MKSKLILLFLVLQGCASLGEKYAGPTSFSKDKALVYFYRVNKFAGAAGNPYICLDNQVVGEMTNGGYLHLEVAPGNHKVEFKMVGAFSGIMFFNLKAGNTYYARSDMSMYNGAKETSQLINQTGPAGSAGAVGGAAGQLGQEVFFADNDEIKFVLSKIDKRAQKKSINPGFLFVDSGLGEKEIRDTQKIPPKEYDSNPCVQPIKK